MQKEVTSMEKSDRKKLVRILIAIVLFAVGIIVKAAVKTNSAFIAYVILFVCAFAVSGYDVVIKAVKNIVHGQVLDENFLMSVATIGAFAIGEYPEAAAVMLFYQVGELFQSIAVGKSRRSISALMDIRPDYANVRRNGKTQKVDPYDVAVGEEIVIKPGERVPLDCTVISGSSFIDTSALTGESVPRTVGEGSEILSGSINKSGEITAVVNKPFEESTVSKILDLVENAADNKSKSENFISKFARYYTPAVVLCALALAVIPPLVIKDASFSDWIYRALTFLVVSCPCALVISIPLGFFAGIGACSKNGILVKGSNFLEDLSKTETAVFDKTGTLTKGVFSVSKIYCESGKEDEILLTAAYAENCSNHPISASLKKAYGKTIDEGRITDAEELSGHGVMCKIDGLQCAAGNAKLMKKLGANFVQTDEIGTVVHVLKSGEYLGYIVISDEVKSDCKDLVSILKKQGISKTVMLTGDSEKIGKRVAEELGIDEAYTELLPGDKVKHVQRLMEEKSAGKKLVFVGDGINDAPVLAACDVGIAMGGIGSDAAIEAADVVIMTDEPSKIGTAMRISRKTLRIVYENIAFSLGVKFLVLILAALGIAPMYLAVFADVGVAVIAILNSVRMLKFK